MALWSTVPASGQSAAPAAGVISIPLLTPKEMPAADVAAAAASEAAIARSALVYGYAVDSTYSYKEIGCPFTPDHILLAYESATPGAVSRFTAVVPKQAEPARTIQIISISRFGAVPYLPAASNPHTFAVFNQVIAAEPVGQVVAEDPRSSPLLLRGLCYLAMAGEPAAALSAPSLEPATIHAPAPALVFHEKGTVNQVISVRDSSNTYQVWTLTFARSGKLLKTERVEHPIDVKRTLLNEAGAAAPQPTAADKPTVPAAPSSSVAGAPSVSPNPEAATAAAANTALVTPSAPVSPIAAAPPVSAALPAAANAAPTAPPATPSMEAEAPAVTTAAASTRAAPAALNAPTTPARPAVPLAPTTEAPAAEEAVQLHPSLPSSPILAVAQPAVSARMLPRPPQRLITNLPQPSRRFIPDVSLPYPPQAPAK